jgi:hypothetical protein
MRKVRAIFMICFALLFGMQGVRMYAQVVGSPVNDKNAIDYRYQYFKSHLPQFADSIKMRNRFYVMAGAGLDANYELSKDFSAFKVGYNARLTLGYRFTPIHAIETDLIYADMDHRNHYGINVNYVMDLNNFALGRDSHDKLEALFIAGVSYRYMTRSHAGINTGVRLQWNPGINCGFFVEPKLSILSGTESVGRFTTMPTLNLGMTVRFHQPNYYLWDYLTPFALKTNLLYDAASALNIGLEAPIGDKWSVVAEWVSPWWSSYDKQFYFQIMNANVEGRYWFGDRSKKLKLTGWFSGLSVGGGVYDILLDKQNGYQGEFQAYSVVGGYAHPIDKSGNLRLEYELGLGVLSTGYVKYWWDGFDYTLVAPSPQSWRTTVFGPTKVQISLVYYLKLRSKVGGRE